MPGWRQRVAGKAARRAFLDPERAKNGTHGSRALRYGACSPSSILFRKDVFMVAAYVVAFGAMLFAGLSALTLIAAVKHLDPPERTSEPPVRVPEKIAV